MACRGSGSSSLPVSPFWKLLPEMTWRKVSVAASQGSARLAALSPGAGVLRPPKGAAPSYRGLGSGLASSAIGPKWRAVHTGSCCRGDADGGQAGARHRPTGAGEVPGAGLRWAGGGLQASLPLARVLGDAQGKADHRVGPGFPPL